MRLVRSLLFAACVVIGLFFLASPFTPLWPRRGRGWNAGDFWLLLTGVIILAGSIRAFLGGGRDRPG